MFETHDTPTIAIADGSHTRETKRKEEYGDRERESDELWVESDDLRVATADERECVCECVFEGESESERVCVRGREGERERESAGKHRTPGRGG